jgi:hypothetical protein
MDLPSQLYISFPDTYTTPSGLAPIAEHDDKLFHGHIRRRSSGNEDPRSMQPPSKKQCGEYFCETCGKSSHKYTTKRALIRHYHSARHRQKVGLPPLEKFHCSLCDQTFSREHDRSRHESEKHRGIKRGSHKHRVADDMSPVIFNPTPPLKQEPSAIELSQERSFIIEDECLPHHIDWEAFSTTIEVYPGPANRLLQGRQSNSRDGEDSRKASTSTNESPETTNDLRKYRSHGSSWFDDSSEDEYDDQHRGANISLKSTQSSCSAAADSGIGFEEVQTTHEPKRPTIITYDYRAESPHDSDKVSRPENPSPESSDSVLYPKMSLIQQPSRTTAAAVIPPRKPQLCPFCQHAFEDEIEELLPHLRAHLDGLKSEMICRDCQMGFVHKEDYDKHFRMATFAAHCGFSFEHDEPCTGHHPPVDNPEATELNDTDRYRLCLELRHWEQSQLHAYMEEVQALTASRNPRTSTSYSIEALVRGSRSSLSSYAVSIGTHGSAPCDRSADGAIDVGGLRHRLQLLSLKKSGSLAKKFATTYLGPSGGPKKALYNAARAGDVVEIERWINLGASPRAMHNGESALSVAAESADVRTMQVLIALGANVTASESKNGCAMSSAARAGQLENLQFLISQATEDVNHRGGRHGSPLGSAAASGDVSCAEALVAAGADVNAGLGSRGCALSVVRILVTMLAGHKLTDFTISRPQQAAT